MPIAALPPATASAPAVEEAEASCVATIETEPLASSATGVPSTTAAVPMRAEVVTLERVIAIAGLTATPPPFLSTAAAPIRASVVATVVAEAERETSWAPVTETPSSMRASTSSVTRLSAKAMPTPTLPPLAPVPTGSAVTVDSRSDAAVIVRSPSPSSTVP